MTTASEFRGAAAELARASDELIALVRPVTVAAGVVVLTGPVRRAVATTADVTATNVAAAATQLQQQIVEAHRRAEVCEAYSSAVRAYFRSDAIGRRWPNRPASWVEYE